MLVIFMTTIGLFSIPVRFHALNQSGGADEKPIQHDYLAVPQKDYGKARSFFFLCGSYAPSM